MALIFFIQVSFLPFKVLGFTKSNCCDFIVKNEWHPIHPTSIH